MIGAYALHGVVDLPVLPGDPLPSLLVAVLAMGLPALAYARRRGLGVPVGLPGESVIGRAFALAGAGALVALAQLVFVARVRDPLLVGPFAREFAPVEVVTTALVPGLLVGGGMALVYHGVLQQDLRTHLGRSGATTAATVLLGGVVSFYALPPYLGDALGRAMKAPAVVLLALVIAVLTAHGSRAVAARLEVPFTPAVAAGWGVLAVTVPLVPVALLGAPTLALLPVGLGYALLAGLAAISYEDSRSLWPPALALAAFLTLLHPSVSRHVVALLG